MFSYLYMTKTTKRHAEIFRFLKILHFAQIFTCKIVCYHNKKNRQKTVRKKALLSQKHIMHYPVYHGGKGAVDKHRPCNFEHIGTRAQDFALALMLHRRRNY